MPELHLTFPLVGGLHARPATALREVALAQPGGLTWVNGRNGRRASVRSVLGLLATETRFEDPCHILAEGGDAAAALASLQAFLAGRFLDTDVPAEAGPASAPLAPRLLVRLGAPWWPATPISPGLGEGPACLALSRPETSREARSEDRDRDRARLRSALETLGRTLRDEALRSAHPTLRAILEAHGAMLADEGWAAAMDGAIATGGWSAASAVLRATEAACAGLGAAESPLLRARALDLQGLAQRLIALLEPPPEGPVPPPDGVLLAERLTPSRFLALDRSRLRALVLGEGGATSHTAILARSFGIPCVAAAPSCFSAVRTGQPLLVDGRRGLVVPDPPPEVSAYLRTEQHTQEARTTRLEASFQGPASTRDGAPVRILANLASPEEAAGAFARGADGVGLFRTEMLFLDREAPPSEEVQTEAYAQVLRAAEGRPVVLRLLDVGGDKPLPFLPLPREANPFLGRRGVRWYPRHADLVRTQVRAALRASGAGDLRLMVPMVVDPEELRWVRRLVVETAAELEAEGGPAIPAPPLGMMVEVPATALSLDAFTQDAAFFSVGTNDLLQYLFAEDRGDPELGHPARAWHPATLRLLDLLARSAAALDRELSLCGELAADPRLLPLLLGLGFSSLSVVPAAVAGLKAAVARLDLKACRALAAEALRATSATEVAALLERPAPDEPALPLLDPGLVLLDAACATKEEAIRLLVEHLALADRAPDPDALEAAIWAREDTYSTGIGHGIAVPHCKGQGAGGLAVLRLREGLPWGALDGQPVRLVLLLASAGEAEAHLRTFARLARRLMDPSFRAALEAAPTPASLVALLESECL